MKQVSPRSGIRGFLAAVAAAGAVVSAAGAIAGPQVTYGGPVSVAYYSDFTDTGTAIDFIGSPDLVDSIGSVSELRDYYAGADSDPNWPSAANPFAADFTGSFDAPSAGSYKFLIGLDDGGYLSINGDNVFSESGSNSVVFYPVTATLNAGLNPFELQYDNSLCCGAIAYIGLNGAQAPIPEPQAWTLMILGAVLAGATLRSRPTPNRACRHRPHAIAR